MEVVLIDNVLSRSEAKFLMRRFIEEKLNFHKLRRLSVTEGDAGADTSWDDERIASLEDQLKSLADEVKDLPDEFEVECVAFLNEPIDD